MGEYSDLYLFTVDFENINCEFEVLKCKVKVWRLKFSLDFLHSSKKCFTFVNAKKNAFLGPIFT